MKKHRIYSILSLSSLFLASCASYAPYAYDDLYYSPNNDPVKQVQKNPREDFHKTDNIQYDGAYENRYVEEEKPDNYPQSIYQNRYTAAEQAENNAPAENNNSEYYDEDYAQTLQSINSPVRSFNTYDSYQRDRILYTQDPFFYTPTLYNNYVFWDPYVPRTGLSVGWNSWSGWNVGIGVGIGLGVGYYDPFFSPWRPYSYWGGYGWRGAYNWGWGNPYWGYDPFYSPYYRSPYWAGYHHGYSNGYYNGGGGDSHYNSNKRYYNTPRGNKGSGTYQNNAVSTRPERPGSGNKSGTTKSLIETPANSNVSTRPSRPEQKITNPNTLNSRPTEERPSTVKETPLKYQTGNTPSNYSRPERSSRPSSTTPGQPNIYNNNSAPVQSRPSYSRPRQSNTYNQQNYVEPQQQSRPEQMQPQRQSRPSMERSRPSYNRSTPSYTPSRSSGGGGSRSVPSRPSRPRR